MYKTTIMQEVEKILRGFGSKYLVENKINKSKVIEDIDNYDKNLIEVMLQSSTIKHNFTSEIAGHRIFKKNEFIEVFQADKFWKDSYTKFSNKIGLTSNETFLEEATEVILDFPYKDTVLKASMSKEDTDKDDLKPDEPFLNEIIAREEIDVLLDKKLIVNVKEYSTDGIKEATNFSENDNLILKGNNLLALHTLKDKYAGKVKLIYIDPPYNTGNDSFLYNDKFNHSTWLTFMKNRLEIARDLLKEDGSIWINIDDDEAHYLKVMSDGIFGRDNFVANIVWQKKYTIANDAKWFSDNHDHILVFAKDKDNFAVNGLERSEKMNKRYSNPDNDPKGPWMTSPLHAKSGNNKNFKYTFSNGVEWNPPRGTYPRFSPETLKEYEANNMIWFGKTGDAVPRIKKYLKDMGNVTPSTFWVHQDYGNNDQANKEVRALIDSYEFSTPKPEKLISQILKIGTNENDIVLDFFMGSATTQAVAHKMGRQYIGIEQMDYINTVSVPRLQKVIKGEQGGVSTAVDWKGGGSFIYAEFMEKNRGYLDDILNATNQASLQNIFNLMLENANLDFRVDLEEVKEGLNTLSLDDQKRTLVKIIDKNQLYYNFSEIDDRNVRDLISDSDYAFNHSFYKEVDDE